MPTTQRLLTDETGQALVTAINNIVAAVKPNATEIQMGANDTTTVAEAINSTNQALSKVANAYKKDTGTLDGLKSDLLAFANTMASQDVRAYQFWASAEFSPFGAGYIYSGDVQKLGSNRFNVLFSSDGGASIAVGYNAGTWSVNQLALKSDISEHKSWTGGAGMLSGGTWLCGGQQVLTGSSSGTAECALCLFTLTGNVYRLTEIKKTSNASFIYNANGVFGVQVNNTYDNVQMFAIRLA